MKVVLKNRCVMCNRLIDPEFNAKCVARYWEFGNFCRECTSLCTRTSFYLSEEEVETRINARKLKHQHKPKIIEVTVPDYNPFHKLPISV